MGNGQKKPSTTKEYAYKSDFIKDLVKQANKNGLKSINLTDILSKLGDFSNLQIQHIYEDINKNKIKLEINSKTISIIRGIPEENYEKVKLLLKNLKSTMNIDISSICQCKQEDLQKLEELECKINRVYVNTGNEPSAAQGYEIDKYKKIVENADKMLQNAIGDMPKNASQIDIFMRLYNAVIEHEEYDYSALDKNSKNKYTARNLEGFFLHGKSVCAGTATALQNLCECVGIEVEYVQGWVKADNQSESYYHAWLKVKLDGKWYNVDPSWDANKVGAPYEFCLKSDEDFSKHHTEDPNYNPTYSRSAKSNTQKNSKKIRTYHKAEESVNSSKLVQLYDGKLNKKNVVEKKQPFKEYLEYANKHREPLSNENANKKSSWKQRITDWFNKLKQKFSKLKPKNNNNSNEKQPSESNANKNNNVPSGINGITVDPKKAMAYLENMGDNSRSDKPQRDSTDKGQSIG